MYLPVPSNSIPLSTVCVSALGVFLAHLLVLSVGPAQPVAAQEEYGCNPQYCTAFEPKCATAKCKSKLKTLPKLTKCGCCDICVKVLRENEDCSPGGGEFTPDAECGPYLSCQRNEASNKYVCTKLATEKGTCEYNRYLAEQNPSKLMRAAPAPRCTELGDYEAKQCKNGTFCQCVSKNGQDYIFGISLYHEAKDMNCHCSRKYQELNEKLSALGLKRLEPINFMRCKANGNFEEFQTYGNFTYCMDVANGTMVDRYVNRHNANQLPCFAKRQKFETKCLSDYNKKVAQLNEMIDAGKIVVGYDLPKCDLDGSYAPVQCFEEECFCVDTEGHRMGSRVVSSTAADGTLAQTPKLGFSVQRNTADSASQTCVCARQLELIRNLKPQHRNKITEMFARYKCDQIGNYLGLQCSDSICYCVDPLTGFEVADDLKPLKAEHEAVKRLSCYQNYHDKVWLDEQYKLN